MITRTMSVKKTQPKQDFLNAAQRKELKGKLQEKFTKLYGLTCPSVVQGILDKFFKSNEHINAKTLSELEKQIRSECVKNKTNSQKVQSETKLKHQEDAVSGAASSEPPAKPKCDTICTRNEQNEEDEEGLDELAVYRSYIAKQEKEVDMKRKELQQKSVRSQLNHQISQKCERKEQEKLKEQKYAEHEHQKFVDAQQRADDMAVKAKMEKQKLLEMQKKILDERTKQLKTEKENERNIDLKITECLKEDLSKAKADAAQKAEEQKRNAAQVMRDNEERKKRKLEQEAQQRKEEMELQNMADKLAQEQEERRNAEIKTRSERINMMIKAGEHTLNKVKTRQDEEEAKIMKYWKRKNEQTDKKETLIKQKEKENKILYRQFLDQQIKEKKNIQEAEKAHIKQQADIWAADVEMFSKTKALKAEVNREELNAYKNTLEEQISKKKHKSRGTVDEEAEKEKLLVRIQELESTKRSIEEKLAVFD